MVATEHPAECGVRRAGDNWITGIDCYAQSEEAEVGQLGISGFGEMGCVVDSGAEIKKTN
jgi:hypothetical protein